MTKIALLGDSHLAALKAACDRTGNMLDSSCEFVFFGAIGPRLSKLSLDGRSLRTSDDFVLESFKRSSNGLTQIEIDNYDAFVLVGSRPMLRGITNLHERYRTHKHESIPEVHQLLSKNCYNAMVEAAVESSISYNLVTMLRTCSDTPIFLIPPPLPDVRVRNQICRKDPLFGEFARSGEWGGLISDFAGTYYARFTKWHGDKAKNTYFVDQPPETIVERYFTKSIYSRIPAARGSNDEEDFEHMNADFGTLQIRALFEEMKTTGILSQISIG